jgi:hypothetical protein
MSTCSAIASAVYVLDVQPMLFGERAGQAHHRLPLPDRRLLGDALISIRTNRKAAFILPFLHRSLRRQSVH